MTLPSKLPMSLAGSNATPILMLEAMSCNSGTMKPENRRTTVLINSSTADKSDCKMPNDEEGLDIVRICGRDQLTSLRALRVSARLVVDLSRWAEAQGPMTKDGSSCVQLTYTTRP